MLFWSLACPGSTISFRKSSANLERRGGRGPASKPKKALGQIVAIQEALEAYKAEYGFYPRPVGGTDDPVVVGKMLYQAVTGDGINMIDGAEPTVSDGNSGTDGEFFLEAAFRNGGSSTFVHKDFYLMDP